VFPSTIEFDPDFHLLSFLEVLRRFELAPVYVGVLFGLKDGANSIASPIWGHLCDKSRKTTVKPYIIMSAALAAASFFLLGSSNVIGIHMGQ
jgi:nitrate/nitrite transporter NarK